MSLHDRGTTWHQLLFIIKRTPKEVDLLFTTTSVHFLDCDAPPSKNVVTLTHFIFNSIACNRTVKDDLQAFKVYVLEFSQIYARQQELKFWVRLFSFSWKVALWERLTDTIGHSGLAERYSEEAVFYSNLSVAILILLSISVFFFFFFVCVCVCVCVCSIDPIRHSILTRTWKSNLLKYSKDCTWCAILFSIRRVQVMYVFLSVL